MSDEAAHRNILAIKAHSERTRVLVKELDKRMNTIDQMATTIRLLESQVAAIQVKLYSGGATT